MIKSYLSALRARVGRVAILAAVFCTAIPATAIAQAPPEESPRTPLDGARRLGDIERMRDLAGARDDAEALVARSELAAIDGDVKKSKEFANLAMERATTDEDKAAAVVAYANAAFELGERDEAEKVLREHLSQRPQAHAVRLALGKMLIARGDKNEGELVLDAFSTFFNNSLLKTSDELTILSKSMATLGSFDDANYAMERAVESNPRNAAALVHWGNLLLEKYNTADAEVTFQEALGLNPNHVGALVGLARVELELSNDYAKVREHLDKAERIAPNLPDVLLTHAEVAVYDTDCDAARGYANRVLEKRPTNLEALTFVAACHYLDDDRAAFEKAKKKVLELNPRYARVLTETARYAVRVHRYEEAVKLDREALEIVPEYAPALLDLGIGLSRVGKEDEGLEMLRRAFEADPYNVRAFNMVELYETQMKDYEFTDYERFRIRAHRSENEAVNALVEPVVRQALDAFDAKYGFEPAKDYLAVEVFPNPTTFAVRSVGLPNVSPHGICFGKVVVSRSPSEGNFNWRQVVWHELAHVYHIQLSRSRVPRWFTEGLAEYETNVKDPAWSRHHDRELARALNAGTLRGVLELSEGFTHARSFEEILRSYHQSSLVIHFIAEEWGFKVIPAMLRSWADFKSTPEVLAEVLETDAQKFDERFAKWLRTRYLNFNRQITVDLAALPSAEELENKVRQTPGDALNWAHLAIARYRQGDVTNADVAMNEATRHGASDPEVNAIAALYYYDRGRTKDSYKHGLAVLDAGRDSYDLRFLLGSAALQLEDIPSAEVHFHSAVTLWEDGAEAWQGLARVARSQKNAELSRLAQERLFMLDQNDPQIARQRVEELVKERAWSAAYVAARRWFDISPFDTRSAEALAEAATEAGKPDDAVEAYRLLAVLRPGQTEEILLGAIRTLNARGHAKQAKELADYASRVDVAQGKIRQALE